MHEQKIILITGPSAAGKSTLAALVALNSSWRSVSEDLAWDSTGFAFDRGDPKHGVGKERHERVRALVMESVKEHLAASCNVVVDFLMYQNPPVPVLDYIASCNALGVRLKTVVLRPALEAIIERDHLRGRPEPPNLAALKFQHECYQASELDALTVVDSSSLTPQETFDRYLRGFVVG